MHHAPVPSHPRFPRRLGRGHNAGRGPSQHVRVYPFNTVSLPHRFDLAIVHRADILPHRRSKWMVAATPPPFR